MSKNGSQDRNIGQNFGAIEFSNNVGGNRCKLKTNEPLSERSERASG